MFNPPLRSIVAVLALLIGCGGAYTRPVYRPLPEPGGILKDWRPAPFEREQVLAVMDSLPRYLAKLRDGEVSIIDRIALAASSERGSYAERMPRPRSWSAP